MTLCTGAGAWPAPSVAFQATTINCERSYRHPSANIGRASLPCRPDHAGGPLVRGAPQFSRRGPTGTAVSWACTTPACSSHFHTMCAYPATPACLYQHREKTCDNDRACHVFDSDARLQRPCSRPTPRGQRRRYGRRCDRRPAPTPLPYRDQGRADPHAKAEAKSKTRPSSWLRIPGPGGPGISLCAGGDASQ